MGLDKIQDKAVYFKIHQAKTKKMKEKERQLQNTLIKLTNDFERNPNPSCRTELDLVKSQLEDLYEEKAKGSMIRARVRWFEEGEKSTKYFLNMEKQNKHKTAIKKLKVNDTYTTNPKQILEKLRWFYQDLYTSRNLDQYCQSANIFFEQQIPQIDEYGKGKCDKEIALKECTDALLKTKPPEMTDFRLSFISTFGIFWDKKLSKLLKMYFYMVISPYPKSKPSSRLSKRKVKSAL